MCGFTGYYNISELNNEKSHEKLFSYINTRGPDQNGKNIFDNITFLFSRLSIIDLSDKGMQPMKSYSGRYIMTFNGEYTIMTRLIYTYL
jgi:Asparagine synthase (glutamine-hydrolyzing)